MMPPEIISTTPFPAAPAVRERPILFSAPMVRALLAGTKTQTRRVAKDVRHPDLGNVYSPGALVLEREPQHVIDRCCPHGRPGDRLWVREAWKAHTTFDALPPRDIPHSHVWYMADDGYKAESRYRQGMFMPRWASRILLEVTDVRVERLQDISETDAIAEGIERSPSMGKPGAFQWCDYRIPHDAAEWFNSPIHSYETLWDQINGAGAWAANPWVWAVSFRRVPPTGGISQTPPGGSTA